MPSFFTRKLLIGCGTLVFMVMLFAVFAHGLQPVSADVNAAPIVFEVKQGDGFRKIVRGLYETGIIRSPLAVEALSLLNGSAFTMRPGLYRLSPAMSVPEILGELKGENTKGVSVTIPEGSNLYQIDAILSDALVLRRGELISFRAGGDLGGNLEGKLFPDTYRFFTGSTVKVVVQKFLNNFNTKAAPLLPKDPTDSKNDLILASIIDKEVPDPDDQKIVAGILWKRLRVGMPLQADATICYAKLEKGPASTSVSTPGCYPLTPLDYKIDSPYNSYLYKGLPPGPIGNPGVSAIQAAINPKSSPYWFYLSDPKTGKTIFATTLDEQNKNRVKYLKGN